jgi:hypothetical protein
VWSVLLCLMFMFALSLWPGCVWLAMSDDEVDDYVDDVIYTHSRELGYFLCKCDGCYEMRHELLHVGRFDPECNLCEDARVEAERLAAAERERLRRRGVRGRGGHR